LTLSAKGALYVTRPKLGDYVASRGELEAAGDALFQAYVSGQIKANIGQRFALERAADAHRSLESRNTVGSTILSV
jgi:NADPH2:quinone reductase